jgi:hypothetical protein
VQPPGAPCPLRIPFGCANASEAPGQVVAVDGMKLSIVNHVFSNALSMPCSASWQVAGSGGYVRFTSSCLTHP